MRGLNALAATISTPLAAPVVAATRLCGGTLVVRADSAFYSAAFTGAVRAAGAFFPVTVRMDPKVKAAIAAIGEEAWRPIKYPGPSGTSSHLAALDVLLPCVLGSVSGTSGSALLSPQRLR